MNNRQIYLRFLRIKFLQKTVRYRALFYFYFVRGRSKFLNNANVRAVFEWLYLRNFFNKETLLKYNEYSGRNK